MKQLLTPDDVAAWLGVCVETVRRLARSGDLNCVRIGSRLRFTEAQVEAFVAAGGKA